jgi:hypothetical protein
MPNLSYQEKSLYGELLADLAVFVLYVVYAHLHSTSVMFIAGAVTHLILLRIIFQLLIAAFTRNRLKDERDRLIRLRGYRAGYLTIIAIMLLGMAGLWVHTLLGQINPAHMALHFLSVFFGVLIFAEVVKTVTQLIAYRRPL